MDDIERTKPDVGPEKGGRDDRVARTVVLTSLREVERARILGESRHRRAIGIPTRVDNMERGHVQGDKSLNIAIPHA